MEIQTHLGQVLLHYLWPIIHGQDDIGDTSSSQSLDLVQDHALVTKLHQGLGQGQSL